MISQCGFSGSRYPTFLMQQRARNAHNLVTMEIIYSFDHYTESWIEVSSRPSTSSLSSAATDDIITTGLHVQHHPHARRRRRPNRNEAQMYGAPIRSASVAGSSQEEYEESESESDRILNSSTEGLEPHSSQENSPPEPNSSASDTISSDAGEDDDGNSTALGVTSNEPVFTPQPNAFSHPPQSSTARRSLPLESRDPYLSTARDTASRPAAHSFPNQRSRSHTPYNMISPSHQADHDAALRASLSTLLSCAAAARGLPKREQSFQNIRRPTGRSEPLSLRMVPESALNDQDGRGHGVLDKQTSPASSGIEQSYGKGKRKASRSKERRETRNKHRTNTNDMTVAPTLMTWVVSAGVVVLFSAISFSAGYTIGREVGRMEAGVAPRQGGMGNKEMGKGLRRLRWGSTSTVVRV